MLTGLSARLYRIVFAVLTATVVDAASAPQGGPPANDECAAATPLPSGVPTALLGGGATTSAGVPSCGAIYNDVWFVHTGAPGVPMTLLLNFDATSGVSPTPEDGAVAVYAGCGGAELACARWSFPTGPLALSIPGSPNGVYVGRVGGTFAGFSGDATATMFVAPPNDEIGGALPVVVGHNGVFSNVGAGNSPEATSGCQTALLSDVWFAFTPTCAGNYVATMNCAGTEAVLAVHAGLGGPIVGCANDNADCGPGSGSGSTAVSFAAVAGTTYYLRAGTNLSGNPTNFQLLVTRSSGFGFAGTGSFASGALSIGLQNGAQDGWYLLAATFAPGTFPNGWLGGLDVAFGDLLVFYAAGPPFFAALDSCGALSPITFGGLPPGLVVYIGAVSFHPSTLQAVDVAPAVVRQVL